LIGELSDLYTTCCFYASNSLGVGGVNVIQTLTVKVGAQCNVAGGDVTGVLPTGFMNPLPRSS
jgi:hypothetical protein